MMFNPMVSLRTGFSKKRTAYLKTRLFFLCSIFGSILLVFFFCEFLVYYLVIVKCSWPEVKGAHKEDSTPVLKAMFLADTHLLGEIRGHWFDKLRREWQMERSYQSALWLLQPDVVFILGDIFDEGKWSIPEAWSRDVVRFQKMFRHPPHTELIVLVGNHDIGFHYDMNIYKLSRFEKTFNFTSGKLVSLKGINFVLLNSVALEGDDCDICRAAENQLERISTKLSCSRMREHPDFRKKCKNVEKTPMSAPILLQHYPLYRFSDLECTGEDSASPEEKKVLFREKYDVLSQDASKKLLQLLQPRLILSGHTHSACEVLHQGKIPEISVPSFSWRNRNNPSFIMEDCIHFAM
ncbi:metallophosphoesterase 1 isoform X2 [Xenopus tropicalis]|uniref:Metallophosphoesterase 1 n=1 Tax=Xenopus tropicalis TaxID=8364 RepID=A0A8J1JQX0_XENTR|nr:metallophosphoesterase 1 isoform X2 [Xenopus tropicalis]